MSKRGANFQIDRDERYRELHADSDDEPSASQVATAAVMSKRKIAMPKKKKMALPAFGSSETQKKPSVFSSFPATTSKNDNEENSKINALNLQFQKKIDEAIKSNNTVDFTNVCEKYIDYIKSIRSPKPLNVESNASTKPTFAFRKPALAVDDKKDEPKEKDEEITVEEPKKKNPFGFLNNSSSSTFSSSVTPAAPVESAVKPTIPSFSFQPVTTSVPTSTTLDKENQVEDIDISSDSSDDEAKDIKVEGPQFTIATAPITSDSVFSFGPKKPKVKDDSDSDSESEIEIKGPAFTFSGSVQSSVFKLNEDKSKKESASASTKEETKEETKEDTKKETKEDPPKPKFAFSFGQTQEPSLVTEKALSTDKPAFSFGAAPTTTSTTTAQETESKQAKPLFSFGTSTTNEAKTAEAKPSFSFGVTSKAKPEESKPAEAKPAFSFGIPAKAASDESKQAVTFKGFGATNGFSKVEEQKTEPAASASTEEAKPKFSFSFGQKTNSEDTNTTTSEVENKKPKFSFGTSTNESDASTVKSSAFSFGSNSAFNSSTAPTFSFGSTKPDAEKEEETKKDTVKPAANFSFSLPFQQSKTSFSPSTTEESKEVPSTTETPAETNEPSDDVPTTSEKAILVGSSNDEENEDVLYQNRAKLMLFNPQATDSEGKPASPYSSQGIGEFKLLQDKTDPSKVRFLLRSDGMGHILLNTYVIKSFTYGPLSQDQENLVKVPVVDPSTNKLKTYVLRVKQKADGRKLINTIKKAQESL